jgi:hypothetical protein
MRPALKPGLIPVWRNRDTVQIGIDPRRAIALTGMRGAADLLALLDGSRDHAQVLAAAADLGIKPEAADRVIALLGVGGALHDFPASAHQDLPVEVRTRLAPELATAALAHGDGDGGARTLVRRRTACVRVHGSSRAGLQAAALLSAAGVGMVVSTGLVSSSGMALTPAGSPGPELPSRRRRRVAAPAPPRRRPDLVVLVDSHRRELPAALVRDRVPHLAAAAIEAIGVVGPLVVPGSSACFRCLDLARADRDPAWPLILAQLAAHPGSPLGCDSVLATTVAAQAAAQALAFIDRGIRAVAAANGTLELVLPDWQWRRRTWPAHPRCDCGTHTS